MTHEREIYLSENSLSQSPLFHRRTHLTNRVAFLRAIFAGIGAILAMIVIVFAAFRGASTADLGAMFRDMESFLGSTRQQFGSDDAQERAIHVQLDAARHHLNVVFLEAS